MSSIAADDERSSELGRPTLPGKGDANRADPLIRSNKCGFVLNASSFTLQFVCQQFLRHILRNHSNKRIRTVFGSERNMGKRAFRNHHGDGRDAMGGLQEWSGD